MDVTTNNTGGKQETGEDERKSPCPCPSFRKNSDLLGYHSMVCGTGGERILRHNAIRDALFD